MAELNLGRVVGQDGERGEPGKSAYAYAQEAGFVGTEQEFSSNLAGINEKANKAPDAVEGNIAILDAEGNPTDSGKNLDEIGGKVPIVSSPPGDEKITFWLNTQVPLKDVPIIDPLEDIEHTVVSAMQYREQGTGETKTIPALSVKSAYQSAVEGGYIGTEEDFKSLLADIMPRAEMMEHINDINAQLRNKADKGLPTEYDLQPIPTNWVLGASTYYKDDFGVVRVRTALSYNGPDDASSGKKQLILGVLPEGYRPRNTVEIEGYFRLAGRSDVQSVYGGIGNDGRLFLWIPDTGLKVNMRLGAAGDFVAFA